MSIFGRRLKYVTCKVWDATAPGFTYPEFGDAELRADYLADRPNLGMAFSGGGMRSASATLGQLRGLRALGLLDKVRYLSCVSGSSFPSTAFAYLPEDRTDDTFLGPIVAADHILEEHLREVDSQSFAHTASHSILAADYLVNVLRLAGDESYARALGDNFLLPFGLDSLKRFFSFDQNSVATILDHNPNMTGDDFYQVRPGRPFLIVNSLILRPENEPPAPRLIPVETTPLYVGIRALHQGAGSGGRDIGGGFVEPFGFDSDAPESAVDATGRVTVRLGASRHRYTLSDVIGSSGAAPAESLAEAGINFLGFPEFKYWLPGDPTTSAAKEYEFGDGGNLENLSLMPLLARKVERIIAFVNTRNPLTGGGPGEINSAIPPVFGRSAEIETNAVLPETQYDSLVAGLLAAKADGGTVMFQDRYQVQDNPLFGIEGGWEVEILWIYNERVSEWEKQLPSAVRGKIGRGSLHNFPHYSTYRQNPPAAIDLTVEQVFLLSNLSCWNVIANAGRFQAMAE